jgi:hypothetical protein
MKKIYTILGQQKLNQHYYGDENGKLYDYMKEKVSNPLIITLKGIILDNEKFNIQVIDSFQSDMTDYNYQQLINELDQHFKGQYTITKINCPPLTTSQSQLQAFKQFYHTFEKNDEVYFDITFGLKPAPMLVMAACNYAYKFVEGVKIKKVCYALFDFKQGDDYVHKIVDVTSIFYLERFIQNLSEHGDPTELINNIFLNN